MNYRIPLVLTPQAEGGYAVTSPVLPELVTEGESVDEAIGNAKDALAAVVELYEDLGRSQGHYPSNAGELRLGVNHLWPWSKPAS